MFRSLDVMRTVTVRVNAGRREFVSGLIRWGVLSVLAVGSALLSKKAWQRRCFGRGPCAACPALDDCRLPERLALNRNEEGA